ncbi:MAG: T9SS type A sorting domain-containing protein [Saprospiraceae bacterium]|nr:T9SS type A sorting domain-containing protein [Saprospiraceae bacterium]
MTPTTSRDFPAGLGEEHLIEPGQDLEYLIRFQNTGTDTAFKVLIVDVLPPELDLASIRPGASSHPYTYGVTPEGWLTFTFDDIMLPDSNVNEPASHGFVRFRASQVPGLGHGDVIANTALIYFDFNAPIQTNTYRHRIGQVNPWTLVGTEPPVFQQKTRVKVVPNPLTDSALLQVEGIEPGPLNLVLTDVSGKVLRQQTTQGTGFEFQRDELNPGLYFFQIDRNGERVGSGKLMVR